MVLKDSQRARAKEAGPWTVLLSDVGTAQTPQVGGKAASLAALRRAHLPVPAGFCVTAAAWRRWLHDCPKRKGLLETLGRVAGAAPEQIASLSEQARACLASEPIPAEVEQAILTAWRAQGPEKAYAVRSSATVEDGAEHSFAGQFETVLEVCGADALLAAVRRCWLSAYSPRALAYLAKHRLPANAFAMAVVAQEMVAAEAAGVLFTVDPTTGAADRVVIEAARGLGEKVVGGHVAPERIVLSRPAWTLVSRAAGGQGVGNGQVLDDATARRLAVLSQRVQEVFSGPLDIEWATHGGALYLLQGRPATVARPRTRTWEERQIWTNGNAGEAFPDVLTPMTASMIYPFLQGLCDNLIGHLGWRVRADRLLGLIAGRPYFNLNLAASMLRYAPGLKPADVADILGGAHEPLLRADLIRLAPEDLPTLRFYPGLVLRRMPRVMLQVACFLWSKQPAAVRALSREVHRRRTQPLQVLSDVELIETLRRAIPLNDVGRLPAMRYMGIGATSWILFLALAKRWFGAEGPALAGRLIAGLGTLDPAEAGRDLWRLAEYAQAHRPVRRAIEAERSFAALEPRLLASSEGKVFLQQWYAFMTRHGHHARGEVEFLNPRWCETPDLVLDWVRHYMAAGTHEQAAPATQTAALTARRSALERECLGRLRNPFRRFLFRVGLNWARRGLALKETVKSDLVRGLCHARLLLIQLGRRLVERGRLATAEDVFFLRVEELQTSLLFDPGVDLRCLIAARRAEYERDRQLCPPPVVYGPGNPAEWRAEPHVPAGDRLDGLAVSPGVATGRARVMLTPRDDVRVQPGEILVAPSTDPAWSPYFLTAAGVAIDLGGILSHGSILAREYGLPAVTNLAIATRVIRTGDLVEVDGNRGRVTVLSRVATPS